MEGFVRRFILMGVLYFIVASLMGLVMIAHPGAENLRFALVHLNLLGWMSMLIFGVGYHVLPRFAGKVLHSRRLGEIQFWAANAGLIGLAFIPLAGRPTAGDALYPLFLLSGVVEVAAIVIFGYNILMTLFIDEPPA